MIRYSHQLLLAAVLSGFSAMSAGTVDAGCHGRSGGSYGGSQSSGHNYSQSSYHSPVYSRPVYQPPVYSQPSYPQQVYSQPSYPQSGFAQQTAYPQSSYGQTQPLYGQQPQQLPQAQQAPTLQPLQQTQQLAPQLPQQTQLSQVQGGNVQLNVSQTGLTQTGFAQAGAPQSLNQANSAPTQVPLQAPTSASAPTVGNSAPVNDATQSALLALGGFAPPQTATTQAVAQAPQTQQPTFTGTWTANLSNGARVQLLLQADGNFNWTAVNKDGQSSSFQGTYSMDNGSLSLSRSTDGQKLSGSLTSSSANNFSFKLSDAQASSLDFVRG